MAGFLSVDQVVYFDVLEEEMNDEHVEQSRSAKDPQDGGSDMAGASHTPGPWEADQFGGIYANDGSVEIAVVAYRMPSEARANARLIAAAPKLLEVALIEQELHLSGFTKATAKRLGPEAEEAYVTAGAPGLNNWRRRKREAAIANCSTWQAAIAKAKVNS